MRISQMKDAIKIVYGNTLRGVPIDMLPDNQVIAIYYSLLERGEFNKPTTMQKWKNKSKREGQMTIFDLKEQ